MTDFQKQVWEDQKALIRGSYPSLYPFFNRPIVGISEDGKGKYEYLSYSFSLTHNGEKHGRSVFLTYL